MNIAIDIKRRSHATLPVLALQLVNLIVIAGSPKGAEASAAVYSLVETAKANGLNPYKYLHPLFTSSTKFTT